MNFEEINVGDENECLGEMGSAVSICPNWK